VSAGHFVSREPFDPHSIEALTPAQEKYYLASQWKLMWWKLKRHRLAVICGVILALNYATIMFSEVIAPYNLHTRNTDFVYSPPQSVHLFHQGEFVGPFVYGRGYELDMEILKRNYPENRDEVLPLRFFCQGDEYRFWGLFEARFHLVCPPENGTFFLLGTDRLGRDMFSRITYGARISLTIGLVGILISFFFGIVIGLLRRLGRRLGAADDRGHSLVSRAAAMDGAVGDIAGQLEPDPDLFRYHRNPGDARLDRAGARGTLEVAIVARRGLLRGGRAGGREAGAYHRSPPAAGVHEPPDRLGDVVGAGDDSRRNRVEFPRARIASAGDQLGRIVERGAKYQRRRALSMAAVSGGAGNTGDHDL
jgi:hypothetical protein